MERITRPKDANEFRRTAPEVLDIESAAKFLGVSVAVLSENLDPLGIPHKRIGRTVIFSRDALVDWVKNQN